MDDLVFFSLILLLFIRIVGLGISIEFFLDKRESRFIFFTAGWVSWITAAFFPIAADTIENTLLSESLYVANGITASVGVLFIAVGVASYYRQISTNVVFVSALTLIVTPILLFFIYGSSIAIRFSSYTLYLIIISIFVIVQIIRMKALKKIENKIVLPRRFYLLFIIIVLLLVVLLSILSSSQYGLYESENKLVIMTNYFFGIAVTVLVVLVVIHYEHNFSYKQNFELKDRYSHDLGNIIQVILSASSLAKMNNNLDESERLKLGLIQDKCYEASTLINEIRDL